MSSNPITKVHEFAARFVATSEDNLLIFATWVAHTWQFSESCPSPNTTPYLYVNSAQKGSGKTLLGIDIADTLARNAVAAMDLTEATLFHMTEARSTLLIDEVDTVFSGAKHERFRGLLNSGYRRGGKVPRMVKGEVQLMSTFGPKILVGIDNRLMPDTIRDRCIPLNMKRATAEEMSKVEPFYHYEVEDEVEELCSELHSWSIGQGTKVRDYKPKVIEGLSPRQWEICQPLLQVAHAAGIEKAVRDALTRTMTQVDDEATPEQDMLLIIRDLFEELDSDRVTAAAILERLATDDRFSDWNGKRLATKLAPFGVKSQAIRFRNGVSRGYYASAFLDAWQRYL